MHLNCVVVLVLLSVNRNFPNETIVLILFFCTGDSFFFFTGNKLVYHSSFFSNRGEFQNKLIESADLNIITYEYFYNGGGIAAGDFNNDGLTDLYFTANTEPNKLYLNKGNLQFQDITRQSNTVGRRGWKTGVSVADVNGDGWIFMLVIPGTWIRKKEKTSYSVPTELLKWA